jgi:hypothetical protein
MFKTISLSNIKIMSEWTAYKNKNLIVPDKDDFDFQGRKYRKIVLNPALNSILMAIDKYWPPMGEVVTSGVRVPADSLRIIRGYLKSKDLARLYPDAMECEIDAKENGHYVWQMAWSNLLNKGVIINPPLPAECLMDYFRGDVNKKGKVINQSPHVRGTSFDLSGTDSLTIVKRLVEDKMIRGFLLERENNCIHCDI